MRRGFKQTLFMVAVALLCSQSVLHAMAPTISNVPDVIVVGNADSVSAPNVYVYPDAINLRNFVSDPDPGFSPDNIIWSYYCTNTANPTYRLNGAYPLSLADASGTGMINPPVEYRVDQVTSGEWNPDADSMTVTVRNNKLTPIDGSAGATATAGIQDTEYIYLMASDGGAAKTYNDPTHANENRVQISSENGGNDRVSGQWRSAATIQASYFQDSATAGWAVSNRVDLTNPANQVVKTATARGLSMFAAQHPQSGNMPANVASWVSPYGWVPFVPSSAWRVRAKVVCDNNDKLSVPLWDMFIDTENFAFGADILFVSGWGSANGAMADKSGRNDFQLWFVPPPAQTAQFTSGVGLLETPYNGYNYNSSHGGKLYDMYVGFRMLCDASAANPAWVVNPLYPAGGYLDATILAQVDPVQMFADYGTLTLESLIVDRFDLSKMVSEGDVFAKRALTNGTPSGYWVEGTTAQTNSAMWTGSALYLRPANATGTPPLFGWGAGWTNEVVQIHPGDSTVGGADANELDNFPIDWQSNKLYRVRMEVSAPTTTDEYYPPDIIQLGLQSWDLEINSLTYCTPNLDVGAPSGPNRNNITAAKAAVSTFQALCYSHSRSTYTGNTIATRLAPRAQIMGVHRAFGNVSGTPISFSNDLVVPVGGTIPGSSTVVTQAMHDAQIGNNIGGIQIHSFQVDTVRFND